MKTLSTREDIEFLVDSFYQKVGKDELIGHVFNDVAKVDWTHHLPKLYNFWASLLMGEGSYEGRPMITHMHLNKMFPLRPEHFGRWLKLWFETIDEHFEGEMADMAKLKARNVANNISTRLNKGLPNPSQGGASTPTN